MSDPVQALRQAAKRRERIDRARREATAELRERIREAQAAGVSIAQIAREAGLSRQGVYDLISSRPPAQRA
jgi:DNA invertase Pin-like site-specific DNA recombinase